MAVPRLQLLSCVVLVVVFSHTGRPAHAQSLVDAARLARQRREALGPPTKEYTNEDLPDTGRITEPTLAWVSLFRSRLEAALERECTLLELLRERPVMPPAPVPVKTVPLDPVPTPPTFGIHLYPVYSSYPGYPVFVASSANPRPRYSTMGSATPAPAPARVPRTGRAISNPDDAAPSHVRQTGRPIHQASRGQERVRRVEPTVPLHCPRYPGARPWLEIEPEARLAEPPRKP